MPLVKSTARTTRMRCCLFVSVLDGLEDHWIKVRKLAVANRKSDRCFKHEFGSVRHEPDRVVDKQILRFHRRGLSVSVCHPSVTYPVTINGCFCCAAISAAVKTL